MSLNFKQKYLLYELNINFFDFLYFFEVTISVLQILG